MEHDFSAPLVDAANSIFGSHPRARALHAKGTWCEGTFTATADAARLCAATHFHGGPVSALIRFSNASGDPESHDAERDGRGMAVKLRPAGGEETDILATMTPAFVARTPTDFLELLQARAPGPDGTPDMEKVGAYLGEHPEAQPALQGVLGVEPPASFATIPYYSPHAFGLVSAHGRETWVRYRWRPEAGEQRLADDEARERGRDYLREELAERLASGPVRFELCFQRAPEDDPLDDPTAVWNDDRELIAAGTLEIAKTIPDPEQDGELVVFDPTRVPDAIKLSEDPILHTRPHAYSVSIERRTG